VPTATPVLPALTAGPTAPPIISPESFAGIWKCCSGYELHTADGGYTFEHTLSAMLNHGLVGIMTIEGDVLTVVEDSSDCESSQVGKYRIELMDADTYHLTMIEDPCTWRARTGSAPLNGATLFRTKLLIPAGIYTKTINQAEADAAGGDLLKLAGQWELQLDGNIGKGKFTLSQDGKVLDSGSYINVDKEFFIDARKLCTGSASIGIFKVEVQSDQVSFSKKQVDCAALIFVLGTEPWVTQ
jgi:hypothetical protein